MTLGQHPDVVKEDIPWPLDDEDNPPPKQQQPVQQLQQPIQQQAQYYFPQQSIQLQFIVSSENVTHLPSQPLNPSKNIALILPLYNSNYRISHQLSSPHQIIQNYDIKQNHDYSKKLIILIKMYINEEKYDENFIKSFNYKFTIFINLCIKVEIP